MKHRRQLKYSRHGASGRGVDGSCCEPRGVEIGCCELKGVSGCEAGGETCPVTCPTTCPGTGPVASVAGGCAEAVRSL